MVDVNRLWRKGVTRVSGIRVYGSPFSLSFTLFPSLPARSNGLHTLHSLFIHLNVPPIICSMCPVSGSSPSLCDQTRHILLLFIPRPLDDRGPFLFHRHLSSSLTYSQARPLSLVVQGSAWGEGFPPSTTQQATCHVTVTMCRCHADFIIVRFLIIIPSFIVVPLSLSNTGFCDWAGPNHRCPYKPSPPLRTSLQPKVLEISSGELVTLCPLCPYALQY